MHKFFALAGVAGMLLLVPARADAACCDQCQPGMHAHDSGSTCDMPCCADSKTAVEPSAVEILLAMNPQLNPAPPVVQKTEVWFHRPVRVGRAILQGRYVIEHDNDRMARGEPCTHIYEYSDQSEPVVAFHCTHLERDRPDANTVVLYSTGDGTLQAMSEFQFAGEHASHGVPR